MQKNNLKKMLSEKGIIRAPGSFDAWSARLVEKAGFPAVYMTGYGVSASVLGEPDIGIISMTEMTDQVKGIASAVEIPLIADADNGYGGVHNVIRTVKEYERNGAAAIQLEDQVFPKRCGHMEGKEVVPMEEMMAKIRAAVYARQSDEFVIVARTDTRAVIGFEEGIRRSLAYLDAGADVIFFEAPQSKDEMAEVAKRVPAPLLANMVEKGKTPFLTSRELEQMGYKIVIYPAAALYAATKSILNMLQSLKENDTTEHYLPNMVGFGEFNELIGVKEARELEKEFLNNNYSK